MPVFRTQWWLTQKAIGQSLQLVLFVSRYNVVLTFYFVDQTTQCGRSSESY